MIDGKSHITITMMFCSLNESHDFFESFSFLKNNKPQNDGKLL